MPAGFPRQIVVMTDARRELPEAAPEGSLILCRIAVLDGASVRIS